MTNTERAFAMTLLHDNPSYQPRSNTAILSGATASNVTQLQENLSITVTVVSAGTDASNIILFEENPIYTSTHSTN